MSSGRAVAHLADRGERAGSSARPDDMPVAGFLDACRREMARRGLTPDAAPDALHRVVRHVLDAAGVRPTGDVVADLVTALGGWGPLHPLFEQDDVEEIWWNDPARVFVARAGRTELSAVVMTDAEARALVLRAVTECGRRLDAASPFVDVQLPDGSRLHVVIPPISSGEWAVNIRRRVLRPTGLRELVDAGALPDDAARVVEAAFNAGANVLVSGGTHSGKTTMLNALLGCVPGHRVVSCEEVRELTLPHADWVALQTRDPGLERTAGVSLRDLIRESLRMRPQRVVVGEVRGPEALDLLLAMNCGVPAAATVHANSAKDAVAKLTGLPLLAGPNISPGFVERTVGSCVDVVIHLAMHGSGHRSVAEICSVSPGSDGPRIGRVFATGPSGRLERAGAEIPAHWGRAA